MICVTFSTASGNLVLGSIIVTSLWLSVGVIVMALRFELVEPGVVMESV